MTWYKYITIITFGGFINEILIWGALCAWQEVGRLAGQQSALGGVKTFQMPTCRPANLIYNPIKPNHSPFCHSMGTIFQNGWIGGVLCSLADFSLRLYCGRSIHIDIVQSQVDIAFSERKLLIFTTILFYRTTVYFRILISLGMT